MISKTKNIIMLPSFNFQTKNNFQSGLRWRSGVPGEWRCRCYAALSRVADASLLPLCLTPPCRLPVVIVVFRNTGAFSLCNMIKNVLRFCVYVIAFFVMFFWSCFCVIVCRIDYCTLVSWQKS